MLQAAGLLEGGFGGRIAIDGVEAASLDDGGRTALRRDRLGFVYQFHHLLPDFTAAENVMLPLMVRGNPGDAQARAADLLGRLGLGARLTHRPAQLSGGEQQRVGIARALAADPRLLLMDEPFGAIDAITRARLQQELRSIQQRLRKTILFVTHDVEEALLLADRILVMRDGGVVQYAPPLELVTQPADEFVSELIGANDIFRQLSLLRTDQAMAQLSDGALPAETISCNDNLRNALSRMLRTGQRRLTVVNADEQPVGVLDYEQVRQAVRVEGLFPDAIPAS
jgi:osmoprotectant transport system ATP-binding protein